ncbi:MAG: helix-turn-helix domain-containing protein [Flavihumibacter sp.]
MKKVAILVTRNYKLLSLAAIVEVLDTANSLYQEKNKPKPFELHLLGVDDFSMGNAYYSYRVIPVERLKKPDLVMVPAFNSNSLPEAISENAAIIPWIQQQFSEGAEVASFCTGAFLLAAAGVLNGRAATTHVDAGQVFARTFPQVKLMLDKTLTIDDRAYTSGGATSSFHLLLHLVGRYCDKTTAIRIAKIFAIDMDRHNQSYFGSFDPAYDHNDDLVASAQKKIESSYQDAGTIEEMIKDIPASRRNIVRRFKQVTGLTPIEYLQQVRVAAAKKLLENTSQQMSDVVFNAGYNDAKAFRKVFRKAVGMTPSEYREKFQVR